MIVAVAVLVVSSVLASTQDAVLATVAPQAGAASVLIEAWAAGSPPRSPVFVEFAKVAQAPATFNCVPFDDAME
jgi:hypothetical protein